MKEEYGTIQELGADIVAISADSVTSHESFCQSLGGCPFPLASDPDLKVASLYGAVEDGGQRGRRSIFVLDGSGVIVYKVPWYQPGNVGQFLGIFQSLGLE